MDEDIPLLDDLLGHSQFELVVAGLRNVQRLVQRLERELLDVDELACTVALAKRVLSQDVSANILTEAFETLASIAGRMAEERRKSCDGNAEQQELAFQAIHDSIDAVADFDIDSYASALIASKSLQLSYRLNIHELRQEMLRDIAFVRTRPHVLRPQKQIIAEFGPLWQTSLQSTSKDHP